ncbi:MAG: ABC transporter ATP-binding protein [Syntrophomonadaceae bacterium]|nr:ABC transporter ATP-binding protein [Syntrophomonadaceae bacterium]
MEKLVLDNVYFDYGTGSVLTGLDLTIGTGEFVAILGASGSGKSTLLRLLAGLAQPQRGRVLLDGKPIVGPGLDRGVVFQDYSLFPWLTTEQNITLALGQVLGQSKDINEVRSIAREYLDLVGLGGTYKKYPGELSGGMRQRAAIARVFAVGSPVLLLDEPFGALDPITRARLQDLLLHLWTEAEQRRTVVFVTHDVEEAILMADRVVLLGASSGRVKEQISVLLPRPRSRESLYRDERFHNLRNYLIDLLNEDIIASLGEGTWIMQPAEGI